MERGPSSGGASFFEGFVAHFGELGITGQGLEVAAQGSPLVGPIISALHSLVHAILFQQSLLSQLCCRHKGAKPPSSCAC